MGKYVCIHGHFYQPPRENPWLEDVEVQDSASPYHDWNERITAECYAPNAYSRILSPEKKIIDIVNNYAKISFNFGSTLLNWLEQKQPDLYQRILEADKLSQTRFSGHGSAIAQVYNHIIMPLANTRDKKTQVIWGIRDFEHRFKRRPEGMWLSETAVDIETLEILVEHGINFTILAPRQARRTRKIGTNKWHDVNGGKIDPRMPYLCKLPSGKSINLFFYDGYIAQDTAFGALLTNGENLAKRLASTFHGTHRHFPIAHVALDGETFGHHHRLADMTLAYCLYYIEEKNMATLTIYGEYLEKHPPTYEVEIWENSSWSCIHGIERWRNDCGCNSGTHPGWTQEWRAPLRGAMDWLRDTLLYIYEEQGRKYLKDPWFARDEYIEVMLDRSSENIELFLAKHRLHELSSEEKTSVLKLLEMQRCAMLMYTSCGWFFDEISGVETVQVLRYASRAMQLAKEVSKISLEGAYIQILARAPSNILNFRDGDKVYESLVRPAIVDILRVGAHYAVSSLFEEYANKDTVKIYSYTITKEKYEKLEVGRQRLVVGKATVHTEITWEDMPVSFVVLHLGDHHFNGGVRKFEGEKEFASMFSEIKEAFFKRDVPQIIRIMDTHFGTHNYSLWHLFREEQRKVVNLIFGGAIQGMESSFQQIYDQHYPIMQVLQEMQIPLPKPLATVMEFTLNLKLCDLLEKEDVDTSSIKKIIAKLEGRGLDIDKASLEFIANKKINSFFEKLAKTPEDMVCLETIQSFFSIVKSLNLKLNLWKAQNIYFSIGKDMLEKTDKPLPKDGPFLSWLTLFKDLGNHLQIRSV